jgi:hypothetical protein
MENESPYRITLNRTFKEMLNENLQINLHNLNTDHFRNKITSNIAQMEILNHPIH